MATVLRRHGLSGWRRNSILFGRPDFVWRHLKLALFVDGCFWHACPQCFRSPSVNTVYWRKKTRYNQRRDRLVARELRSQGWRVLRVWECQVFAVTTRRCLERAMREAGALPKAFVR